MEVRLSSKRKGVVDAPVFAGNIAEIMIVECGYRIPVHIYFLLRCSKDASNSFAIKCSVAIQPSSRLHSRLFILSIVEPFAFAFYKNSTLIPCYISLMPQNTCLLLFHPVTMLQTGVLLFLRTLLGAESMHALCRYDSSHFLRTRTNTESSRGGSECPLARNDN